MGVMHRKPNLGSVGNEIAKENNLRGIFVREVLKKMQIGEYTEKEIEKAIEIGLETM